MRTAVTGLLLLVLCLTLAPLPARGADPVVYVAELKDVIHGTITVPGEMLSVNLYAPAGTKLKLKAKKDGKEDPGVTLALTDPKGATVPLDKGKALLTTSEGYRLTMTAAAGRTGKFLLTIKGTPPTKAKFSEEIAAGVEKEFTFSVMPSTSLDYSVKKADAVRITYADDADVYDQPLFERKAKGLLLKEAGDYVFRVRGSDRKAKVGLTYRFLKIRKRDVWLSEGGFGTAPVITSLDPAEGLRGSTLSDMVVTGGPFDPAVEVWLQKDKELIPATTRWESEDRILVSMDLVGAKKGKWKLVTRNPSGAWTDAKFKVIAPSSILLPDGIEDGTEIWYLEFNDNFATDLYEFGLARSVASGGSAAVNRHVQRVVKAYVLYWLRHYFGLPGKTGAVGQENIPVSFILAEAPAVAGAAGVDYNRIEIGGTVAAGADSDNPDLSWGRVAVDVGNLRVDDITGGGGAAQATAKVPVFELRPSNTNLTTKPYRDTFAPLVANPVADTDAGLFSANPSYFLNLDDASILRYKLIVPAIEMLGKEIAAIAAHHIARAMGLTNGDDGLMDTPALFGEFAATEDLGFTTAELTDLWDMAKPMLLPGKSTFLRMKPFQGNPGQPSVIEFFGGTVNQERQFLPTGGRPDKKPSDMRYEIYYNTTGPLGVVWPENGTLGLVSASPPIRLNGALYTDAVLFVVVVRDTVDGSTVVTWGHRMNVLVDTSNPNLTPAEAVNGLLLNRTTREGPAR